jgi:hypothetical protein
MSKNKPRGLFGKVKKTSKPQFSIEHSPPPPPPKPSRTFNDLRKETIERISQEEREQKQVAKEIADEVASYNATFGVYNQINRYNHRIYQDNNGDWHVRNNVQGNRAFERFFEAENISFNHFLVQHKSDLVYHLNSQKTGGTSDYNDAAGNFSPTKFKSAYLNINNTFNVYNRTRDAEVEAELNSMADESVEELYLRYNSLYYQDRWMAEPMFTRNDGLIIAYMPSDAGKSVLFRNFKHYYFDIDHLKSIGTRKHEKFRFFNWLSIKQRNFDIYHNFFKNEIRLNLELIRGKILLAHSPAQIPENLRLRSTEVKLMVQKPVRSRRKQFAFDYASLDNYWPEVEKVFIDQESLHFFLYNYAVSLGYNPTVFR